MICRIYLLHGLGTLYTAEILLLAPELITYSFNRIIHTDKNIQRVYFVIVYVVATGRMIILWTFHTNEAS
jgi:hypothetical protein